MMFQFRFEKGVSLITKVPITSFTYLINYSFLTRPHIWCLYLRSTAGAKDDLKVLKITGEYRVIITKDIDDQNPRNRQSKTPVMKFKSALSPYHEVENLVEPTPYVSRFLRFTSSRIKSTYITNQIFRSQDREAYIGNPGFGLFPNVSFLSVPRRHSARTHERTSGNPRHLFFFFSFSIPKETVRKEPR